MFDNSTELNNHQEECSNGGNIEYECAVCGLTFLSEHGLRAHSRLHSDEGATCDKCGKYFRQGWNLRAHQIEECGRQPGQECPLCPSRFHFKAQLNAHLIESHSDAKLLDPLVDSSSSTDAHQPLSQEERYQCELCPRAFARVGSLNYHVSRKHSGGTERSPADFPFLCIDCGNRYKSSTQLCRHRRWECGKEPMFKCQLCVKKFHHRHGLKQHIRLHLAKRASSGGRSCGASSVQFCCEKCGRGYKLKSSLNNHIKWECGKEPVFPCSLCNVRFSHKGNLKKHILTKHVEKPVLIVKNEVTKS